MIYKELDDFSSGDAREKAGRVAEEQMAFYLRRAFGDDPDVRILNHVRLERDGDAAQMDHLVLHRHGIIIVESKSVSTRVRIKSNDEWERMAGGRWQGMASPVLQAERQADFLRRYLRLYIRQFLGNPPGVQPDLARLPIRTLVAVSDNGMIERKPEKFAYVVQKADQIPGEVRERLGISRIKQGLLGLVMKSESCNLSTLEQQNLAYLLLTHHHPRNVAAQANVNINAQPVSAPTAVRETPHADYVPATVSPLPPMLYDLSAQGTASPAPEPESGWPRQSCRKCGSNQVCINYGQYGYYFHCVTCQANAPTLTKCAVCGNKERVRKQGRHFFAVCDYCRTEHPYHRNPAA